MCGRFVLAGPEKALDRLFGLPPEPGVLPRWNIAPGQRVLAVRRARDAGTDGGTAAGAAGGYETLSPLWGFVPPFAGRPDGRRGAAAGRGGALGGAGAHGGDAGAHGGDAGARGGDAGARGGDAGADGRRRGGGIVNARAETAARKPAFRAAFRTGRCLVPADGFYEWAAGRPKRPWLFRVGAGAPFALGAITAGGTLAVLTTGPNALVARVHVRMPLIVPRESFDAWLDPDADVAPLLAPYPADEMDAWPVSPFVNKASAEGPGCIERDEPPRQGTLF